MNQEKRKNKDTYVAESIVRISNCLHCATIEPLELETIDYLILLCNIAMITLLAAQKQACITKYKLDEISVLLDKITDSLNYIKQTTPNHIKRIKNNIIIETREVYLPWNAEIEKLRTEIYSLMNTTKKYCEHCGLNFDQLYEEASL